MPETHALLGAERTRSVGQVALQRQSWPPTRPRHADCLLQAYSETAKGGKALFIIVSPGADSAGKAGLATEKPDQLAPPKPISLAAKAPAGVDLAAAARCETGWAGAEQCQRPSMGISLRLCPNVYALPPCRSEHKRGPHQDDLERAPNQDDPEHAP